MSYFVNATATAHPSPEQLYANTDFSQLSWLENQWANWYLWMGNPILATGLLSFLVHELVYFGRCVPWVIIDAIPYFRKWKLQPNKVPSKAEQWECTKLVLFSHFAVEAPVIWMFHPLAERIGMSTWQVPLPSWRLMLPQIALFFVFEDMFHYFSHQLLHTKALYKHIHKIHHKYSAPFGLAAEYAHPLEVLILGTGTIAGPLMYSYVMRDLHIFTVYVWIALRLFQAIDAHSGYDFPWSLQNIIPFWSGAEHHDFHHMAFVNNYSTSFRWCDWLGGTDTKYRAYRKRMADAKKQMEAKKASEAEWKQFEERVNAEEEAEGAKAEARVYGDLDAKKVD